MNKAMKAAQSRAHLDVRFQGMGPLSRFAPPVCGWVRALRRAAQALDCTLVYALVLMIANPRLTAVLSYSKLNRHELGYND